MQRRSFVKKLFGVVLAGLAAPRLGMAAAEPIVVVDPAAPFMYGMQEGCDVDSSGTYLGIARDTYVSYPLPGSTYRRGDTFEIGRSRTITKVD